MFHLVHWHMLWIISWKLANIFSFYLLIWINAFLTTSITPHVFISLIHVYFFSLSASSSRRIGWNPLTSFIYHISTYCSLHSSSSRTRTMTHTFRCPFTTFSAFTIFTMTAIIFFGSVMFSTVHDESIGKQWKNTYIFY